MAVALAGCRKALAGPFLPLLAQMSTETAPVFAPVFVGAPFHGTVGSFQSGKGFAGRRALTNVCLLK